MSWQDLFWRGREAEVRVSGYFQHPDQLTAPERVAYYDRSAAETIKRLRETAEALEGYRQALAARYATLAAMPYEYRLDLVRHRGLYDKHVTYTVALVRVYQDGHEEAEESTTYPGTQRHEALKAFEALQRSRPGIKLNVDIERKAWER